MAIKQSEIIGLFTTPAIAYGREQNRIAGEAQSYQNPMLQQLYRSTGGLATGVGGLFGAKPRGVLEAERVQETVQGVPYDQENPSAYYTALGQRLVDQGMTQAAYEAFTIAKELEQRQVKKDKGSDIADMVDAMATFDDFEAAVKDVLNDPNLSAGVGFNSIFPTRPGSPTRDFELKVERLKGGAFLQAIQQMRGLGALSNAEGRAATQALTALELDMSEEGFKAELRRLLKYIELGRQRLRQREQAATQNINITIDREASAPNIASYQTSSGVNVTIEPDSGNR